MWIFPLNCNCQYNVTDIVWFEWRTWHSDSSILYKTNFKKRQLILRKHSEKHLSPSSSEILILNWQRQSFWSAFRVSTRDLVKDMSFHKQWSETNNPTKSSWLHITNTGNIGLKHSWYAVESKIHAHLPAPEVTGRVKPRRCHRRRRHRPRIR